MGIGCLNLAVHHLVCLTKYMSSLGMTDKDIITPDVLYHNRGILPGKGPLFFVIHVLNTHLYGASLCNINNFRYMKGGREKHHLPSFQITNSFYNALCQVPGFCKCIVHLPVSGEYLFSCHQPVASLYI